MISLLTDLEIVDNSGAKVGACIKILKKGGRGSGVGVSGDNITVAIKKIKPYGGNKIEKGQVKRALIVRTKKEIYKRDGSTLKFKKNAAIILKKFGNKNIWIPYGTRIKGFVSSSLFNQSQMKIKSLSSACIN